MKRILFALALTIATVSAGCASPTAPASKQNLSKVQGDTVLVQTTNLATPMKVTVVQPSRALEAGNTEKFPTVYLLNGFGGDYRTWPILQDLDSLANVYGMIFVCPDGCDSWYWDSPIDKNMQMESFFVNDLVPFIDNNFPTIAAPEKRAITGLSMGGHGALYLAMRHPDLFKNAGSTSGGVDIRPFPTRWKMKDRIGEYEKNKEVWDSHTVATIAKNITDGQLNIIFDCGAQDFFAQVNSNLHNDLLSRGVSHDYISRPGTHNGAYWHNSILYQLLYFNRKFEGK